MKAIGLDIGTTSFCGILLNTESKSVIKKEEKSNQTWIASASSWEKMQDPEQILKIAFEVLETLYDEDVVSIGITGQMHGIVYVDDLGNAVSPLYTWQDERGNLPYQDTTYAKFLNSYTGYGYVTHFYNQKNGFVPENATVFCTIHDYVAMKLAGKTKPLLHSSDAASFGQYDLKQKQFTIADSYLPESIDDYAILGYYHKAVVSVAIGDNQASFIGSVCGDSSVLINVGTGSQVSAASDKMILSDAIEVRPYVENRYLMVGASLCGGKSFMLIERFFRETVRLVTGEAYDNVYESMNKALSKEIDCSLKVDNRFMGTRKNPDIRGSITDLSPENFTPEQVLQGMLNGMAEELYQMFSKMNVACKHLVGSGNGIRKNPAFANCLSKKFEASLKITCHKEEASFGAALFSLVAAGVYQNIAEAQTIIQYEE